MGPVFAHQSLSGVMLQVPVKATPGIGWPVFASSACTWAQAYHHCWLESALKPEAGKHAGSTSTHGSQIELHMSDRHGPLYNLLYLSKLYSCLPLYESAKKSLLTRL
jgi:hypothetical protein